MAPPPPPTLGWRRYRHHPPVKGAAMPAWLDAVVNIATLVVVIAIAVHVGVV